MSLTREQALAAAWLALAFDAAAAPPPGGTISQGAAAAKAGAAGLHKGSAGPKKVATAPGAVKYHAAIGSLIIPHGFHPGGGEHYAAGAPGHMIHDVSQAKWIANQWKGTTHAEAHAKAKAAAEQAVAVGTHHWVQAGEHAYAVHNGLDVHVPKDTDIHDPGQVKHAPKVIVKHGPQPEHVMLHGDGTAGEVQDTGPGDEHLLGTGYKKLPPETPKKSVSFAGKHAAWVPHDWQVHKETGQDEGKLAGKYAKDPAGHWHLVTKSGGVHDVPGYNASAMDDWAGKGGIVPDTDHPGPEPGHVAPNQAQEGHEPPKADVGGVAVTKDEIHAAIQHLNEDKSTAVKQPLAKKGHPLAAMDYHAVAKAELAAHPELKIPPGTKKAHVGQVKVAVLHHLAGQAGKLAQDEAHAQAAKEAKDKAEAAAQHAQQLTPGTYEVGGVHVTAQEITQAVAKLEGSSSTQIKGLLKGNPLVGSDYWAVVNAYKDAHPAEFGTGTKHAHVAKAKPLFVAALKELAGQAATGEVTSGHGTAAAIDQALSGGTSAIKPGWNYSADGAIAMALAHAADKGQPYYASLSPIPGEWMTGFLEPEGKAYYEVTPEHKVITHLADGKTSHEWAGEQVAEAVKEWTSDSPPPEPKLPEPEPVPKPVLDTAAWKQTPEYQAVHDLISHPSSGQQLLGNTLDTDQQLAMALYLAAKSGNTRHLYPGKGAGWEVGAKLPAGVAGTFGVPGKAYYEVTPAHEIVSYGTDGQGTALPGEQVKQIAEKWLTPPPAPQADIPVWYQGNLVAHVPAGSVFYEDVKGSETGFFYIKKPDGAWEGYNSYGTGPAGPEYLNKLLDEGELHQVDPPDINTIPAKPEPEKPPEPAGPDIPVVVGGEQKAMVPAGSKFYKSAVAATDAAKASVYVKKPDGTWTWYGEKGTVEVATPAVHDAKAASGELKEVSPGSLKAEPAKPAPEKPPEPEPAKPEPAADTVQLKQFLVNGAIKPSSEVEGGKESADWALAAVLRIAAKFGTERWLVKQAYSGWQSQTYQPYTGPDDVSTEYYHVSPELAVVHHAGGTDTTLAPEQVAALAHQMVVPDSVKVQHPGTGAYQMVKHGFYYKPSKSAKAYLEVKPWQPGAKSAGATFIYHAPSGDKEVNAGYAAKVLADATEFHAQAKDAPNPAAKKVSYVTTVKPGSYQIWSDTTHSPSPDSSVELHDDGSVLLKGSGSSVPMSASAEPAMLQGGVLLDQFGTTVVSPGVVPDQYHVFGSEAKTPAELQSALDMLEQHYDDKPGITQTLKDFLPGVAVATPVHANAVSFWNAKLAEVGWEGQRDSFMGLLRELLAVPAQPPGAEMGAGGVKFLKGLPPGIASAHDVFTWTGKGYAKPAVFEFSSYATSPELSAKIKAVSEQFGGGKVVGTHVSSLTKDQKAAWLKAFQAGDMAAVFAYDAFGGKVSPAHPGAPGNADTHHVTWSPWDDLQVPAGQAIEGAWSPEGVIPPKAEVDNFLIKAGLQHAAWLTTAERRQWMQAHRGHDQLAVDKMSRQAADAFHSGAEPKSEPPAWTDNLGPAGPFDAFLDEKTPAQQWPASALDAFLAVHKDELGPFVQQAGAAQGYDSYSADDLLKSSFYGSSQIKKAAVQLYLDDLAAKQAAEKLKPKYHLAGPGIAGDQFGRQYQFIAGTSAVLARRSAVAALARTFGFRTPQVTQVQLEDGTAGAVAPLLKHDGTLAHLPAGIAGLTSRELGDIAREHVLDYALANPGSTPGSYLRTADGSVVGADKSGALSDLGWQGADLAGMNTKSVQPVSLVFAAIADGSLSQDQAAAAYTAAIRAARRMASLSDVRLQQALDAAGLDKHSGGQLAARKNALPDTVGALWDGVFAQRGWTPPEVPAAKISRGLHSGFSEPEFLDHVAAAKSFGVPAFFNEPGLDGGHVLVWTELGQDGQRLVRGEAAVRKHELGKVTGWVKAHSGDSASMVPKGEVEFHDAIQNAAMFIDKHNVVMKNYDYTGPATSAAMTAFASAKSQLTHQLADAQHALAAGPGSAAYAAVAQDYGDPASVVSMAQFYLAQVETAEQAKAAGVGTGLSPEQFPAWKAVEQSVLTGGVKITYKKATRQLGTDASDVTEHTWSLGKDDGELHLAAGKSATYPGYVWQVQLPTGEVIEINDAGETQTPKAHTGMIRFTSVAADGTASLERVRAFLQHAGLGMEDAGQADMENLYWRIMAWVLSDRADRKDPKHMKVWDEITQALHGQDAFQAIGPGKPVTHFGELPGQVIHKHMAPEEEAQMWRKAWAHLTSPGQVQQWVDNEGFLPHLGHFDIHAPEVPGGKPDWFRFDVTPQQAAANQMLTEALYSPSTDAPLVVRSGGLFSSDARLRALGIYKTGMSWGSDMSHGASGGVFTRQNMQSSHSGMSAWINPRVLARTQTYAFPSDKFGEVDDRRTSAYFDFAKASAHSGAGNEALIRDAISLLDDIEVLKAYSETQRQQIIADLKGAGITEIRGLPAEDRIVTSSGVPAAIKKAVAAMKADGWFAQPEQAYVPPPSALSGAPAAEKKFASQVVTQQKMADAAAQAAKVAQQLEELAKGVEVPFSYAV